MTDTTITAQAARGQLYEIIQKEVPFEEKAREALELGQRYLDADNGHLTRIDQETDHWEAIVSTDSADGRFPPGLELDLGTTYCRRTIEANGSIALSDAPNQGWADDPAYETHGLHCYHGTSLIVDGDPYGTVCFVADDPRGEFSDGETMFAELIAKLLERELEREQYETELLRQTNLALVLNRVLRHNLRNDMSVIRGFTQLMADELGDNSYSTTALDTVDKLIQLAEKARQLDRIVAADFEHESVDITELIEDIVERVTQQYPNASVSVEYDKEIVASILPSFERALEELIENAAKHSDNAPIVTVSVEAVPNAVEIQIADNGPGLASHEADVLQTGTETPLTHGSGLGLWLSHWIVTSHDGSIDAIATDEGTIMTITIPRKKNTNVHQKLSELTRARDQYEAAFEEANDGMIILNDDARLLHTNSEASNIFGLDNQEMLGQPLQHFLPEEFEFDAVWDEFLNAGRDRGTVTIVGANSVERQVEYSATADIIPGQHLVVSRDITEHLQRDRALEQAETLFQNAQDALFLVNVGEEFAVQRVNPAYEKTTGRSNADVRGKTSRELLGEEQGRAIERRYRECVERREPLEFEEELQIDGETTFWDTRIAPVVIDNEVAQLVGATRDVTERKTRERRYDAVFNNTYQFMGLLDSEGRLLEANKPALAFGGLDQEEIVGKMMWETHWFQTSTETRKRAREAVERAVEGEFVRMELTVQGKDQEAIIDFSIRPVTDDQGAVTYLVPEGRNITQLKEQGSVSQTTSETW